VAAAGQAAHPSHGEEGRRGGRSLGATAGCRAR